MKTRKILLMTITSLLCLGAWAVYGQQRKRSMAQWEYLSIATAEFTQKGGYNGDVTLNQLGAQGWELVATSGVDSGVGAKLYFKRRR